MHCFYCFTKRWRWSSLLLGLTTEWQDFCWGLHQMTMFPDVGRIKIVGWGISVAPQYLIYNSMLWHILLLPKPCSLYNLDITPGHIMISVYFNKLFSPPCGLIAHKLSRILIFTAPVPSVQRGRHVILTALRWFFMPNHSHSHSLMESTLFVVTLTA